MDTFDVAALVALALAVLGALMLHKYISDPHPGWIVGAVVLLTVVAMLASFAGNGLFAAWLLDETVGTIGN